MENIAVNFAVAVALTIGLTEVVKRLEWINPKYLLVVSLVIGLAIGIFYISEGDIKSGIWQGIGIGLSASGLFSGVKNMSEGQRGV